MKKTLQLFAALTFLLLAGTAKAQTYSAFGDPGTGSDYEVIDAYDDTLYFTFTGLPLGGYGDAHLVVFYEGDFGDNGEFITPYLPGLTPLAQVGPNPMGDCAPETTGDVTFNAATIDTWGGTAVIKILASNNVDPGNCFVMQVKVRLDYSYCLAGTPQTLADFTVNDNTVCPTDGAQTFTGTPAGGTFTGTNVTGNSFDPTGLTAGSYDITYTATDAIGCTTSQTHPVRVLPTPGDVNVLICEGEQPELIPGGPSYVFSDMLDFSTIFDTAATYVFPSVTTSPTMYYYAKYDIENYFQLDTVTTDNAVVIDIDALAGDDRGGIAVTNDAVYMTGDNSTVRYDLDLLLPGVSLPRRDGMFSDLRSLKIYSLYNSVDETMFDYDFSSDFTCDAIIELDADLEPTSNVMMLSTPLLFGSNNAQSGVFAGYGELVIYNGNDQHAYAIDLDFADVTDLGAHTTNFYGSENWADWGVAGYDGADYTIYYRDYNFNQIVAHNLTTDNVVAVSNFSDVSDLASFVIHPVSERIYFHYEGGAQFGGSSETLGYLDGADTVSALTAAGGAIGCPSTITYTFNSIDFGPDTTVCTGGVFVLQPGPGYLSYTWNGSNNNWNIFPVVSSGTYTVEAVDEANCTVTETIVVTVDPGCVTGIEENQLTAVSAYPVPNNGSFNLDFGQSVTNAEITLVNMQGVICHRAALSGEQTGTSVTASGLAPGVYFVRISSKEGMTQLPVVIQ